MPRPLVRGLSRAAPPVRDALFGGAKSPKTPER